jgi:arylsulfatase A-like enzyme
MTSIEALNPAPPRSSSSSTSHASTRRVACRSSASDHDAGRPAFIWLHYMDPHFPYDPPTLDPAQRIHHEEKASVIARLSTRSTAAMAHYVEAYNAEVEYFDHWLGNVIEMLKQNGLWDSAIVVFWSDHGEEFWEHGSWEHGHSLYDELLHVPLMIHMPGQTDGERVSQPVSLLDVMPTLLDLAGISGPDEMRGRSLAPTLAVPPDTLDPMHLFLEACSWGDIRKGLFTGRYKLIYDLYHDRFSLYDLQDDPGELHDIFGTEMAPDTRELEKALLEWTDYSLALMQQRVETGREELSPEARQHLRDMGYIQ